MDTVKLENELALKKKAYENRKAKLRENYRYSRDKGFTPLEAQALSFHSKEEIDELATRRAKKG